MAAGNARGAGRWYRRGLGLILGLAWVASQLGAPPTWPLGQAQAHTIMQKQQVCPLDGTRWTATLDGSGTSFGQYLDMKPFGPTPAPWRLAVCPKDHFVMYQDTFTPNELATLRPLIESAAYQALAKDHSEYFLLGTIFEHHKRPPFVVALAFVRASWQVDRDPVRYAEYATEALRHYERGFASPEPPSADDSAEERADQRINAELLAGELERRLGRFDAARARFSRLQGSPQLKLDILRSIVAQQLALIAAKDATPQRIQRPSEPTPPHPRPADPPQRPRPLPPT